MSPVLSPEEERSLFVLDLGLQHCDFHMQTWQLQLACAQWFRPTALHQKTTDCTISSSLPDSKNLLPLLQMSMDLNRSILGSLAAASTGSISNDTLAAILEKFIEHVVILWSRSQSSLLHELDVRLSHASIWTWLQVNRVVSKRAEVVIAHVERGRGKFDPLQYRLPSQRTAQNFQNFWYMSVWLIRSFVQPIQTSAPFSWI